MKNVRICAVLLALALTGCSGGQQEPEAYGETQEPKRADEAAVLYLGTSDDWENTLSGQTLRDCCQEAEAASEGMLEIRVYDQGSLGTDGLVLQGVAKGTVSMAASSPASQWDVVPQASLLCVPGLFENTEEFCQFLDLGYRETLQGYYQEAGLYLVACMAVSDQRLATQDPLPIVGDFSGLTLGMENNPALAAYWNALGAQVQGLEPAQLYRALNQEQINALACTYEEFVSQELNQYLRYLTPLNFSLEIKTVVMNQEQFDALSPENQRRIQELGAEMEASFRRQDGETGSGPEPSGEEEGEGPNGHGAYPVTYTYLSYDVRERMLQAKEASLSLLREELGNETVDTFLNGVAVIQNQR